MSFIIDQLSERTQNEMMVYHGTTLSAGALGLSPLYSFYTDPTLTIRRSSDSSYCDFYADFSGNLGTGYLATGTSLNTWLNGAYAYVSKWWDQTGNQNHATQTTTSLQPIYNTTQKYIDFGTTTTGGNLNAYFNLPNGAFPYGNSEYSYVFKHGVKKNITVDYETIYYGGNNVTNQQTSFSHYLTNNNYINRWFSNDVSSFTNSYKDYSNITDKYDGTKRYIYVNGISQNTLTGGVRNQSNTNNRIGRNLLDGYGFNSQLYYFYFMPMYISDTERNILETTFVSPIVNYTPSLYLQSYLPLFTDTSDTGLNPQTVTTVGSVTFDVVKKKKCIYFNGNLSNYLYFNFTDYSQFTISFWVFVNDTDRYTACSISNITTWNPSLLCDFSNNIGLFVALSSQWSSSTYTLSGGYTNKWIHVAYTVNQLNYTGSMYVNGSLVTSVAGSAALGQNKSQIILGRSGDTARSFNGYIQQFQLYNILLAESQIQTIYNETMSLGDVSANYINYTIDQLSSITKTAMINNGTTLSAGAFGLSLLYSVYTGPVMTIRRSSDSSFCDFYADICGNMGTGYLATNTSLDTWLNGAYAYVTKWWDQTGNQNHATQTIVSIQPVFDTIRKYIDFGTTTPGGNVGAYFDLPNSAFPYGNSTYSYIFKHGFQKFSNGIECIYNGGGAQGGAQSTANFFGSENTTYTNGWSANDIYTPNNTYKNYSTITNKYDGTNRYIYVNGIQYSSASGGRNQSNINNRIGAGLAGNELNNQGRFNSQLYYFYFMPISISFRDSTVLESTHQIVNYTPSYVSNTYLQSYLPLFTDISDNGSNPQTVTTVGSVTFKIIDNKKCAYFDRSLLSYLYFNFNNDSTSQFTISFWFYMEGTQNLNAVCSISNINNSISSLLFTTGNQNINNVNLALYLPNAISTKNLLTSSDTISNTLADTTFIFKWIHVAIVVNRRNYNGKLYINGSYVNSVTGTSAATSSTPYMVIGGPAYGGYMRQFQLYNTLLTDSQIQTIYNETNSVGDISSNYKYAFDLLSPPTQALFLNDANAFSAGGLSLRLLHSRYTGPIITIRRSSDSYITDFYADICGNLGTRYLATGTSLNTWLNGAYAYVTIWWDQTGNFNHATQNTTSLQPIYNTTQKYIDFGTSTTGGNANAYFNLRNSAFPYGNSAYSYIFKHGINNLNTSGTIYSGGPGFAINNTCSFQYNANYYINSWSSNDVYTSTYGSYKRYSIITNKYDGTSRYICINGVNQTLTGSLTGGVRIQPNTNNTIGRAAPEILQYNSQLYFFYFMPISIPDNDRFILETVGYTDYVTFFQNNIQYTTYPGTISSNQVYIIYYFDEPNLTTLNIPSTVQYNGRTYNVVNLLSTLGSYSIALQSNYVTTVNIPASVTNISVDFFSRFQALTNFVVNPSNTIYKSFDGFIYNFAQTILYFLPSAITEITTNTLVSTLTSLSDYNFSNYIYLTNVTLPSTITTLGNYVFNGCTSLLSVNLNSVTTIGNFVFNGCTSLLSVNLNSVATIGNNVFNGCTSLPSITIPNTLTTLGEYTFNGCTSLVSVDLNLVATIGNYVFNGCTSLPSIIIPNTITILPTGTFNSCTSLNSISFQSTSKVNYLGDSLFSGCTSLKTFTMPDSVLSGNSITNFLNSSSLVSVIYSNGLATITSSQGGCNSLLNVTIQAGTTVLQADSFNQCSNLLNFTFLGTTITPTITSTGSGLGFGGVTNKVAHLQPSCYNYLSITPYFYVSNIDSSNNITFTQDNIKYTTYAGSANNQLYVSGCTNDPSFTIMTIPSPVQNNSITYSVYFIGISYEDLVFTSNYITTVNIPYDISYIKSKSFTNCYALTAFTVDSNNLYFSSYGGFILNKLQTSIILPPNGLTNINTNSFPSTLTTLNIGDLSGCLYLTTVTLPNTITTFGNYVFNNCTSLVNVTIPNSLTNIGTYTFMNCTSLTAVYFQPTCQITSFGTSLFSGCTSLTTFTMPNSVTSVKTCFTGSYITNLIYSKGMTTIPIGHTANGNGNAPYVINVTIPAETTTMYDNSFLGFSICKYFTFLGKTTPTILAAGYAGFGGDVNKQAYVRSDCSYSSILPYFSTSNIIIGKIYKHDLGNNIVYSTPYFNNNIITLKYSETNSIYTRSLHKDGTLRAYDNMTSRNQTNTSNFIGNDNSNNNLIGTMDYMCVMPISINGFNQKLLESISTTNLNKIPGLTNWYDASDPYGNGSIPINGVSITKWVDKSNYCNTMIGQASGIYYKNVQNGLGTIFFNGSWYRCISANASYPSDVFIVLKLNTFTSCIILGTGVTNTANYNDSNSNGLSFGQNTTGCWSNASFGNVRNGIATSVETSTDFLLIEWSIGNNNFFINRNGTRIMTNTSTWSQPTGQEFLIGRYVTNLASAFNGYIAEIAVFNNQLSTTYRTQVEKYLSSKWGLYYS